MKTLNSIMLATSLSTILIGCGGGGSSSEPNTQTGNPNTQTVKSAQFIDGTVQGIRYVNGTRTGYTNANGEFTYENGNISFYLGKVLLGTIDAANVPSDNKLFVQDLVGVDRNETSNPAVLKMAGLLQTLDADPSTDTIEINATARAAFDANTTLANFPDANITNAYTGLGITRAVKSAEVEAHLEDMRRFHGEVSDTTAPTLVSNDTYNNVDLDNELCIDFSERIPKNMLTSANFTVNPTVTGTLYRDDTAVCLTPDANLTAGQTYTFSANGAITDYAGNALGADASVSYTTKTSVPTQTNRGATWSLKNYTNISTTANDSYIIDLSSSTDPDGDTLTYTWTLKSATASSNTIYSQDTTDIAISTQTSIDFASADNRTATASALPKGSYTLAITAKEDSPQKQRTRIYNIPITISEQNPQARSGSDTDAFIIDIDTTANATFGGMDTNQSSFYIKAGYRSSVSVDCDNDGTYEDTNVTGVHVCSYTTPGFHQVAIKDNTTSGTYILFEGAGSNRYRNQHKIINILQWGTFKFNYPRSMFQNAVNLRGIASNAGTPDLSAARDAAFMFYEAKNFNADISNWDVSNITSMRGMFYKAAKFNQDINDWNISKVTDMSAMFEKATNFDQTLSTLATKKKFGVKTARMFLESGMSKANTASFINDLAVYITVDSYRCKVNEVINFSGRYSTGNIQSYEWHSDRNETASGETLAYTCSGDTGYHDMHLKITDATGAEVGGVNRYYIVE
jgi:surface protein